MHAIWELDNSGAYWIILAWNLSTLDLEAEGFFILAISLFSSSLVGFCLLICEFLGWISFDFWGSLRFTFW